MNFFEAVKLRRSIRKYKPDPVPQESVDRVLEAARATPSWKNMQCWRLILVDDPTVRAELAGELAGKNPAAAGIEQAPYTLVVCGVPAESGKQEEEDGKQYYMADCGLVFENIMLAAAAEGLGTVFVGWFDQARIQSILGIPADVPVVGFTPLGYPDEEPRDRGRKPLDEILYRNAWGRR